MADNHTLVFTKCKSGATYNTANVGIMCLEGMPAISYEVKDAYQNDWLDEDGAEVYDADSAKLKASEITIPMGIVGIGCNPRLKSFVTWLTTGGMLMDVNIDFLKMQYKNVLFSKVEPEDFYNNNGDEILTFKLTLKITSPEA